MIDTVLNTVVSLFQHAGLHAKRQYSAEPFRRESGCVVCVGLKSSKRLNSGYGEYLGIRTNENTQEISELYGFRLELSLGIDIFSPFGETFGAEGCRSYLDKVLDALSMSPSGLMVKAISAGEVKPDREAEMLRCTVKLDCEAYLIGESNGETPEFTSFVLKGAFIS